MFHIKLKWIRVFNYDEQRTKKVYIDEMTTQFEKTEAVIVTHYQGLTVTQLDDLGENACSWY